MKIKRSFSAKIQIKQFEPIESICEVEDFVDPDKGQTAQAVSEKLDEFCRDEVRKTLDLVRGKMAEIKPVPKVTRKPSARSKDIGQDDAENDIQQELPPGVIDVN